MSGPAPPTAARRTSGRSCAPGSSRKSTSDVRRASRCRPSASAPMPHAPGFVQPLSTSSPPRSIGWAVHPDHRHRAGQGQDRSRQYRLQLQTLLLLGKSTEHGLICAPCALMPTQCPDSERIKPRNHALPEPPRPPHPYRNARSGKSGCPTVSSTSSVIVEIREATLVLAISFGSKMPHRSRRMSSAIFDEPVNTVLPLMALFSTFTSEPFLRPMLIRLPKTALKKAVLNQRDIAQSSVCSRSPHRASSDKRMHFKSR